VEVVTSLVGVEVAARVRVHPHLGELLLGLLLLVLLELEHVLLLVLLSLLELL
jgi:hypothetical protein